MDNNGEPIESGGGGGEIPDDLNINSVCAVSGTFQNLGVGPCGAPLYELPTDSADDSYKSGVILSQGGTIELIGGDAIFEIAYGVGVSSFIRQFTFADGEYSIQSLLSTLATGLNSLLEGDGSTNRITLSINASGFVVFFYTSGNSPFINLTTAGGQGWLKLGLLAPTIYPPNTPSPFPTLPNYSDTSHQTRWSGYNFDDTGSVYVGDMTITGALTVNTIISDIEVEDAIITLNKNGLADNNTSGVVINGNSNSAFSGLLKNSNSDNFFLFANSATLPTETGWVPEQNGNLYINDLFNNTISSSGLIETLTGLQVGFTGAEYILPSARASGQGYVLISGVGTNTEWSNRIKATLTQSLLTSPNNLNTLSVSDADIFITDGTRERFKVDSAEVKLTSPNGNNIMELKDTDFDLTFNSLKKMELSTTQTLLNGGLTNQSQVILGGGPIGFRYSLDTIPRMTMTAGNTTFLSPTGVSRLLLDDNLLSFSVSSFANTQLQVDLASTSLRSENTLTEIILENNAHTLNVLGALRVKNDATQSTIYSPDTLSNLEITNNSLRFRQGGNFRINADTNSSNIYSPDSQTNIGVADGIATTTVAGVARLRHNATDSRIVSPDQSTNMIITNTDTIIKVAGNDRIEANAGAVRIGGAYDIPIVAGTEGQYLEVNSSGNLVYTLGQVYASLQANTTTAMSLPLQNTYYPFNNGVLGSNSGQFTFGALGLVTYTGTYPLVMRLTGHASIERTSGGGSDIFSFSVLKNGAFTAGIGECRAKFDDSNTWPLEVSFEGVTTMTTGDTLQLAIANEDAAATTANVYSYSLVISKI